MFSAKTILSGRPRLCLRRTAYGKRLSENPLQNGVLFDQEVKVRGILALLLECAYLYGAMESGTANEQEKAVCITFIPILKLFSAKESLKIISEGIEAFGGIGYLEDSGLPAFLRNAQVLNIFEGTSNVIAQEVVQTVQVLGPEGWERIAQWLRYAIDMVYVHPSEVIQGRNKAVKESFHKIVMLYSVIVPIFAKIAQKKGSS